MLNKSFAVIYFYFSFLVKKQLKIGVSFLGLDQKVVSKSPKTHY